MSGTYKDSEERQARPPGIIDTIDAICEMSGDTREVNLEFCVFFAEIENCEMAEIIFDLMRHQADFIKNKPGDPVTNATNFTASILTLVASGHIAFDDYGRINFFKPIGQEPTPEMWEKLEARIDRARPLMEAIARRMF